MRHYNGKSTWKWGHRWVSSVDGFDWEFHDKIPLGGINPGEQYLTGSRPETILLVTKKMFDAWLEDPEL